jgi:hypothetical protein
MTSARVEVALVTGGAPRPYAATSRFLSQDFISSP